MKAKHADSDYKQEEAEKRRDDLLRSLLHTPPAPRPSRERGKKKPTRKPAASGAGE